ncbi:MAG: hypothetical protein V4474_00805 [Patescibacteria group bacterium]
MHATQHVQAADDRLPTKSFFKVVSEMPSSWPCDYSKEKVQKLYDRILPLRLIDALQGQYPGCKVGRWVSIEASNDRISILVTLTYRSPDRCVVRRSVLWIPDNAESIVTFGMTVSEHRLPKYVDELPECVVGILKPLMKQCCDRH